MTTCPLSDEITAKILKSPTMLKKVRNDFNLINNYNARIAEMKLLENPNTNMIATLEDAKNVSNSNIIYV
jgi:hypothetical protein